MPTPLDSLKVGRWIAVTGQRFEPRPLSYRQRVPRMPPFSGAPFQILAISYPFVCVEDVYGDVHSIDTRYFEVTLLRRAYVHAILDRLDDDVAEAMPTPTPAPRRRACPMCGGGMFEQKTGSGPWEITCRECSFRGTT